MNSFMHGRFGWCGQLLVCVVALSPCIVGRGWRAWPPLVIWTLGCAVRLFYEDRQVVTDCYISAIVCTWLARRELKGVAVKRGNGASTSSTFYIALSVTTVLVLIGLWLWHAPSKGRMSATRVQSPREGTIKSPRPKIFQCRTTHSRTFPSRHTFDYSYLQCGYPIVPDVIRAGDTTLPNGKDRKLGFWWMFIRADDYLDRCNGSLGFYGKLQMYLRDQRVQDSEWSYAYLLTAPRFFGYAFNPMSFWYIYDVDHRLKKMILEVNNTFGERRMYLLDGSSPPSPPKTPESQASSNAQDTESDSLKSYFTDIWMKDFHVSSFNSRKGSYRLKALDPFPYGSHDNPLIDNTITLRSSRDHAKLVVRLYSTRNAVDPDALGLLETLGFISEWWWVGLVTFPRILREAFKLYFLRNLNIFTRPEVLATSMGRLPTAAEIVIYKVFRDYLFQLVQDAEEPFCITFKAGIPGVPTELIETIKQGDRNEVVKYIEFRVLTPAFYSRLAHYAYTSEAFDRECVFTDERNRTLWVCRPQLLSLLLSERHSLGIETDDLSRTNTSYLDELRWRILKRLRCAPGHVAHPLIPQSSMFNIADIRARSYSEIDHFVRSPRGHRHAADYRRAATTIFLAERLGLGFTSVVDLLDLMVRILLCRFGASQLMCWDMISEDVTWQRVKQLFMIENWSSIFSLIGGWHQDWWWRSGGVALILACHAYGLSKGYQ